MDSLKLALACLLLVACPDDDDDAIDAVDARLPSTFDAPPADAAPGDGDRDIVATALSLDLTARNAIAAIELAAGGAGASFEIGDLAVDSVEIDDRPVDFTVAAGRLDVDAPAAATTVVVQYRFAAHTMQDGWDESPGFTFLWPYFCKNLFPCDSRPLDGQRFTLSVTGVPGGKTAIYPTEIPADAPSYMPAIAVGEYTYVKLGETAAGTEVGYYYLPLGQGDAAEGAGDLDGYVDWLEQHVGAYHFGDRVASVPVDWGFGSVGGMEHHPFWHVAQGAMAGRNVHAHEAAHGWFGNGVRLRCWEDFVLSEGTATYLAARAIEGTLGAAAGQEEWDEYERELRGAVLFGDTAAWPSEACNSIDLLHHPVWSSIPYYKGAFFLRAVEKQLGRASFDATLADFYAQHVGGAAGMEELIAAFESASGADLGPLVDAWLRGSGVPPLP